jgi:hypothetical protein
MSANYQTIWYKRSPYVVCVATYNPTPTLKYIVENLPGDTVIASNNYAANPIYSAVYNAAGAAFADNLARAAFYKKLGEAQTRFHGMVFYGELRETLRMLRRPAAGLQDLIGSYYGTLSKRKRAKPHSWKKDIGSIWLEQAFGWNPFLNDIKDAAKAWEQLTKPVESVTISAQGKKAYDMTASLPSGERAGALNGENQGCYYDVVVSFLQEQFSCRYKGSVISQVEAIGWQNARLFGFVPEEFIPTAWELLPWSFLADYVTNIGDILNSAVYAHRKIGYVNVTKIHTVNYFRSNVLNAKRSVFQSNGMWTFLSGSFDNPWVRTKHRDVVRSAQSGVAIPSLQFNLGLNDGQLMNVAALLTQFGGLSQQSKPRNWHR